MIISSAINEVLTNFPVSGENETEWVSASSAVGTGHRNFHTPVSYEVSVPELCHSSPIPMSSGRKMDALENASSVVINKFKPFKFTFDSQIKFYD